MNVQWQVIGGAVSFADGIVFHLWHGEMRDRRLGQRYPGLSVFQFGPYEDITGDHNGPLRWNTPKYEMHKYVRNYFSLRNEDG